MIDSPRLSPRFSPRIASRDASHDGAMPVYSRDELQRIRGGETPAAEVDQQQTQALPGIETEMPDAAVCVWDGQQWLTWNHWAATHPIETEASSRTPVLETDGDRVTATCGTTQVWLVRAGERWTMLAGPRRERVRPFASPWLDHARRCAEARYGAPKAAWVARAAAAKTPAQHQEQINVSDIG